MISSVPRSVNDRRWPSFWPHCAKQRPKTGAAAPFATRWAQPGFRSVKASTPSFLTRRRSMSSCCAPFIRAIFWIVVATLFSLAERLGQNYLVIAFASNAIRSGKRGRFYSVIDLVDKLEQEHRNDESVNFGRQEIRLNFVVLDELGYLPFSQTGAALIPFCQWLL